MHTAFNHQFFIWFVEIPYNSSWVYSLNITNKKLLYDSSNDTPWKCNHNVYMMRSKHRNIWIKLKIKIRRCYYIGTTSIFLHILPDSTKRSSFESFMSDNECGGGGGFSPWPSATRRSRSPTHTRNCDSETLHITLIPCCGLEGKSTMGKMKAS